MIALAPVVAAAYTALLAGMVALTLHRLGLAWRARRHQAPEPPRARWPTVVVQLPLYNERAVVERLLEAVSGLDYPRERWSIQVLDDSTDDTSLLVAQRVAAVRARGVRIEHLTRAARTGFKAGALAHGLAHSDAELVAIFDADFVPAPDFLQRLVPHFENAAVGMVQARWGHLNRAQGPLTGAQAVLLDGHFFNEQAGRAAAGVFFNFNGTAGIWRRAAIDAAGGWLDRSLTEDLDLSYRAQLAGWTFVYRGDVVVPAELPARISALKSQQHRWSKGALEAARALLPSIWRTPGLGVRRRLAASLHLLGHLAYPAAVALTLGLPAVLWARQVLGTPRLPVLDAALFGVATVSLIAFHALGIRRAGTPWRDLPFALVLGAGLTVNNTRAVFEALRGRRSAFVRTPKQGERGGAGSYRLPSPGGPAGWELAFGVFALLTAAAAIAQRDLGALPWLLVVGSGSTWVGALSLLDRPSRSTRVRAPARRPAVEVGPGAEVSRWAP